MKVAIIGAGNGGQAMAAYLKMKGCTVTLQNRSQEPLLSIVRCGGITLTGVEQGKYMPDRMTCDIGEALCGASYIMVCLPANSHRELAAMMAPHVVKGQTIVLNPGRTFGAYEMHTVLRKTGAAEGVNICETDTFLFTCRAYPSHIAHLFYIKRQTKLAALDRRHTAQALEPLRIFFPNLIAAQSTLETGLNNFGMILHPAPTLFNIARIESGTPFFHYAEGITPIVATFLHRMDVERMQIAHAIGAPAYAIEEWIFRTYGVTGNDLYTLLQSNPAYRGVEGTSSVRGRYIEEDVMTGIVPMLALARHMGLTAPTLQAVLDMSTTLFEMDYYRLGRSEHTMDMDDLFRYIREQTA